MQHVKKIIQIIIIKEPVAYDINYVETPTKSTEKLIKFSSMKMSNVNEIYN